MKTLLFARQSDWSSFALHWSLLGFGLEANVPVKINRSCFAWANRKNSTRYFGKSHFFFMFSQYFWMMTFVFKYAGNYRPRPSGHRRYKLAVVWQTLNSSILSQCLAYAFANFVQDFIGIQNSSMLNRSQQSMVSASTTLGTSESSKDETALGSDGVLTGDRSWWICLFAAGLENLAHWEYFDNLYDTECYVLTWSWLSNSSCPDWWMTIIGRSCPKGNSSHISSMPNLPWWFPRWRVLFELSMQTTSFF